VTVVLAVDPGGTSGWAMATLDGTAKTVRQTLIFGEHNPSAMADWLRTFCRNATMPNAEHRVLVMERFTITPQTGKLSAQYDALELIGLGRYLAEWHDVEFDLTQAPGDAKAFAKNESLRNWGVWVPVQEHARDAVRHLCLAAAKRGVFLGRGTC
jgi:hypothetical protein